MEKKQQKQKKVLFQFRSRLVTTVESARRPEKREFLRLITKEFFEEFFS